MKSEEGLPEARLQRTDRKRLISLPLTYTFLLYPEITLLILNTFLAYLGCLHSHTITCFLYLHTAFV